jgi:hypothetical protein
MKIDWKRKLTSRKLWASLANFVSMLYIYFGHAEADGEKIAAIILAGASVIAYVIGEGLADSSPYLLDNSEVIETDVKEEAEPEE